MAFNCARSVSTFDLREANRQQEDVLALALALAPLM